MGLDPQTPKNNPLAVSREAGRRTVRPVKLRVPKAKKTRTGRQEKLMGHRSSLVTHCVRRGDKSLARMGPMCL